MSVHPFPREMQASDPLADPAAMARRTLIVLDRHGEEIGRLPDACSGNCSQGRMCDCVADLDEPEPAVSFEHQAVLASLLWAFALVCLIALCRVLA
jgi:hypothetical protein